jgi:thiol-disulfide isomerase/thioredoxin
MSPGRREAAILVGAGLVAAGAGFLLGPLLSRRDDSRAALAGASFLDLAGHRRNFAEWRSRVLVCNFWATWCAPCREEIPLLVSAWEKYAPQGVEVVGIAVDNAAKVAEFARTYKVRYPVLLGEADGLDLMRKLGNNGGGLPFTVFLDRKGRVATTKLGALHAAELEGILGRLTAD